MGSIRKVPPLGKRLRDGGFAPVAVGNVAGRWTLALLACIALAASTPLAALAQPAARPTPVEVAMSTLNGAVRCEPRRMRLPARAELTFTVVNRSPHPLWFAAPEFIQASRVTAAAPAWVDPRVGGFLVQAHSRSRLWLRTPPPGEYYYACSRPNRQPRPASTGFIIAIQPPGR